GPGTDGLTFFTSLVSSGLKATA
ncbi:MAG: hypothetical protein JWO27_547, partial [Frankiales bacterium]|nr:hypothetical protein [Frankiales bacterium]